jgi:hypothetical protein
MGALRVSKAAQHFERHVVASADKYLNSMAKLESEFKMFVKVFEEYIAESEAMGSLSTITVNSDSKQDTSKDQSQTSKSGEIIRPASGDDELKSKSI